MSLAAAIVGPIPGAALEAYLNAAEDADEVTSVLDELYAEAAEGASRAPGAAAGRRLVDSGQWEW